MSLGDLILTPQPSIGPVIPISGVGPLPLGMTKLLRQIVGGSGLLQSDLRGATDADRELIYAQLRTPSNAARLSGAGIALTALSGLLPVVLIPGVFMGLSFNWALQPS